MADGNNELAGDLRLDRGAAQVSLQSDAPLPDALMGGARAIAVISESIRFPATCRASRCHFGFGLPSFGPVSALVAFVAG